MPNIEISQEQAEALARGESITLTPYEQTYTWGYKDGDVVWGPFGHPGERSGWGLGVVDGSQRLYGSYQERYVPIRVLLGVRGSGGYYPDSLRKVERPS